MKTTPADLERLAAERDKLITAACGPARAVAADKYVAALCTRTAEIAGEASTLFDLCATAGPHGDGPEGIRVRRDAARLLYDNGHWRELERLAGYVPDLFRLVAFEIRHAGRPKTDARLFAAYGASGTQLPAPPLTDAA